ncbi:unnamed protein product [Cunninghamella blakesleeana]
MPTIQALDSDTICYINSGQVITTIDVIIKELLENSLNAGASNIEIKLVKWWITIKDNGSGILLEDRPFIGKQHYTSKISKFEDIEKLSSFGFRGEALHALCVLADVHVITKTKNDKVAICYKLDHNGNIKSEVPSGNISSSGTIVSIIKPFYNIPVRRQMAEKMKLSINRIQELIIKYSLSHPSVRLSLNQIQDTIGQIKTRPIWIKPTTKCLLDGVRMIYGRELASMLEEVHYNSNISTASESNNDDDLSILKLSCLLPTKNSDPNVIFKNDNVFVYVNQRPISYYKSNLKELIAMVRQRYKQVLGLSSVDNTKSPFMYIDIQSSLGTYDVNIEPDKTIVMFLNKQKILDAMEQLLDQFYGSFFNNTLSHNVESISEQKSQTVVSPLSIALDEDGDSTDKDDENVTIERKNVDGDKYPIDEEDELESDDDESPLFIMDEYKNTLHVTGNNTGNKNANIDHHSHDSNSEIQLNNNCISGLDLNWQINDDIDDTARDADDLCDNNAPISHSTTAHQSDTLAFNWFDKFRRNQSNNEATNSDITNTPVKRPLTHSTSKQASSLSPIVVDDVDRSKRSRLQTHLDDHFTHIRPSQSSSDLSHSTNMIAQINLKNNNDGDNFINSQHININEEEAFINNENSSALSSSDLFSSSLHQPQPSKNFSIFGNVPKRRDIVTILNSTSPRSSSSSPTLNINRDQSEMLTCTLNKTAVIDTPYNIEEISKHYHQFRHRYSYFYRKPLNEYHQQVKHYISNNKNISCQSSFIPHSNHPSQSNKNNLHDVGFITQNVNTEVGWLAKTIGAVNINKLLQNAQFQKYMDDYVLECDSILDNPVQLKISKENVLYNAVLSLTYQEKHDDNDQMYSEIIDPRIVSNGFHAQWRIEPTTKDLIINITSIFVLKGYGLVDFKELLALIQRQKHQKSHDISLSKIRPSKVVYYFRKLTDNNNNNNTEISPALLKKLLPNWDENEKSNNTTNDSLVYTLM